MTTPTHYIVSVQLVHMQFCYQSDYITLWRPSIEYTTDYSLYCTQHSKCSSIDNETKDAVTLPCAVKHFETHIVLSRIYNR